MKNLIKILGLLTVGVVIGRVTLKMSDNYQIELTKNKPANYPFETF